MYTISKEFHFSASHQLDHLPDGHQCARLHGHNYIVVIELKASELDDHSFVVDYGDLWQFKNIIDGELDHRHLNDILPVHATAENLARWLYNRAADIYHQVTAVKVSETPKTWAEYRP